MGRARGRGRYFATEIAQNSFYTDSATRVRLYANMSLTTSQRGALKIKDAAKYLGGVAPITVRRLIKRGLLKPNRALRHVLIPIAELDRFLSEGLHRPVI